MPLKTSKLNLTLYYFFALLIVYLPFQRLLEQILLNRGFSESLAFWTTHFYEPLVIIVLIVSFFVALKNGFLKRINWVIVVTAALIVLSIISIFVLSPSVSRGIEGFRFTIFFLLAFLTACLSGLDQKQFGKLINIYLIMAGIFALWGILERFLPVNYLMLWGLISPDSGFGYGAHKVVTVYQSVTGIGGPNQLASYLLSAIFIALTQISNLKSQTSKLQLKTFLTILVIFGVTAVILSFSRSAWVGLYVGLLVSAIILIKNFWFKIVSVVILLALAAGMGYYYLNKPNDVLTHGASDAGHQTAFQSSILEIKNRAGQPVKLLFGSGIGTAGPAALKYGDGFVSESWYLQLALELGIIGVLLWLTFIILLLVELYKKNKGLFLALISVSTAAVFLHTFADNPAISITLFLLIGLTISNKPYE